MLVLILLMQAVNINLCNGINGKKLADTRDTVVNIHLQDNINFQLINIIVTSAKNMHGGKELIYVYITVTNHIRYKYEMQSGEMILYRGASIFNHDSNIEIC